MTKKITFLLCVICCSLSAQNIQFPDVNFKNALLTANTTNNIAKNQTNSSIAIDANNDGEIQVAEATAVYYLNLNTFTNISDLQGISNFSNLRTLNFVNLAVSALDISGMANLKKLTAVFTPIATLNVVGCLTLEELNISNNTAINHLNVSGLPNLKIVNCGGSSLVSIDVSNSINIEDLHVSNTQLTTLDVSGLANLQSLRCDESNITNIVFAGNTNLSELWCSFNQLTSLDLSGLSNLTHLNAGYNQLTSLDLSGLSNLTYLDAGSNNLTSLDLTNINIEHLFLPNNQITNIDLSQQLQLNSLGLLNNMISSIDLPNMPNLVALSVGENQLSSLDVSNCPNLNNIDCSHNSITSLDFSNNPDIVIIWANDNALTSVNIKNGANGFLEDFFMDSTFANNPDLMLICADENEIPLVHDLMENWGIDAFVNTYCSPGPAGNYNSIAGVVSLDGNNNGCGSGEITTYVKMNIESAEMDGTTYTNNNGNYNFLIQQTGNYTLTPDMPNNWFALSTPTVTVPVTAIDNSTISQNFCVTPNGVHNDVEVVFVPLTAAQPGFNAVYKVVYKNKGNQALSGSVTLSYDDDVMDFVNAVPAQESTATGMLTWDYTNLLPFESRSIIVTANINSPQEIPAVNIDDVLIFSVLITPETSDETPEDNSFEFNHTVTGSFDPNDITCLEGAAVSPDNIGEYLHYNINFENTGTAAATFIIVENVVNEAQFDLNTLELLDASHNFNATVTNNKVTFRFDNINLGPNQKGNITYKIKTVGTVADGDEVMQKANIFFDYNFPIETNDAVTVFQEPATEPIINIPDTALKNLLLGAGTIYPDLAKDSEDNAVIIDANGDGEIQVIEAMAVWAIEFNSPDAVITTMEGIQYFTNLRTLICTGAGIDVLPITGLVNLDVLECGNNDITSLDASGCVNLKRLECHDNNIQSLDVSMLENLESLSCSNNQMQSLLVAGMGNLINLSCSVNEIETLDMSGLTNLKYFLCNYNNLTNLNFSALSSIEQIDCSSNNLSALNFAGLGTLGSLNFSLNPVTSVVLTGCTNLNYLRLNYTLLTQIDLAGLTSLASMYCENSILTSLTLANLPALFLVQAGHNDLNAIAVQNVPQLSVLQLESNGLASVDVSQAPALTELYLYDNPVTSINVANGEGTVITIGASFDELQADVVICVDPAEVEMYAGLESFEHVTVSTTCSLALDAELTINYIELYPNPSNGIVNISADANIESVELYDIQGRLLQSAIINEADAKVDLSKRAGGIYFLRIKTDKGIKMEKIVKN